ncbi:uncharacterized protein N7458_003688 [Penicillium daleae]|uniref:Major facilitator superfamily (MFS) profile domain-containing protein n=1 Tax=Penicillium daleae TaxID=63821 RepID=A0AAD6CA20_9EURO|nr:uncharacterized protein N7458_003688 [Penicillium daleae]KAJ5456105.1 hypothetical protein N7458_003688 [Penicillium daleae]
MASTTSIETAPVASVHPNNDLAAISHRKSSSYLETSDIPIPPVTAKTLALGAFISIGGLLFGYDTGQISGFENMSDFVQRYGQQHANGDYYFSNVRSGLIVSILSVGTLIGALTAAPIADHLGRKLSISVWCGIILIGLIVQITAPYGHWYQLVVGRFVAGLGIGACSLIVPMYQGESAPRHIRGAMISCYQLFVTFGILLAYLINLGTEKLEGSSQWRITLGITFVFALLLGIGVVFFPESPRFEVRQGKLDSARRTMAKLYGIPENHIQIIQELEDITLQLSEENHNGVWYEIFKAPRMAYRLFLGMMLQTLQQLTGANYFFYYVCLSALFDYDVFYTHKTSQGTTIFKGAGISNSFVTQVILGAVNFGTTFGGLYAIERFGRRKSLMTGAVVMFICFIIFASVGHFSLNVQVPEATPGAGKTLVVVACIFIAAFAMTWGPMVWTIVAELYPSQFRAKGMALATASNWFWNFLIGFFTPFITDKIDFAYGYVFAGCLAFATFSIYLFVIEGKGRTLEEIDYMYVMKVAPWHSEQYQIPPRHEWVALTPVAQEWDVTCGHNKRQSQHTENV